MKYLVCIDGSKHGDKAFNYVLNRLEPDDELILAIGVEYINNVYAPHVAIDLSEERKKMEEAATGVVKRHLQTVEEKTGHSRDKMSAKVLLGGQPKEELLEIAKRTDVDLVVCGSRGLNPFDRLLIGSTSEFLVHNSPKSVLIIR